MLNTPYVEQESRRKASLVTPVVFDVTVGASATDVYVGADDRSFLIRALAVVNDTAGAITATLTVDGNQWYTASAGADSIARIAALEGMLIDPAIDVAATGENLRIVGWGLRVAGGDTWAL